MSLGRLPPATDAGWPSVSLDWEPRNETAKPAPGIIGPPFLVPSLGVLEKMFPSRSITAK